MSYVAKLENTSDSYIFHKGGSFISNPGSVKLETISDLYIFHKGGNWRLIQLYVLNSEDKLRMEKLPGISDVVSRGCINDDEMGKQLCFPHHISAEDDI